MELYFLTGDGGLLQALYPTKRFQLHRRLVELVPTSAVPHRQSSCHVTENNVVLVLTLINFVDQMLDALCPDSHHQLVDASWRYL